MIEHLDNLLRHLFLDEVARLQSESQQIWFQPPDDEWRSHASDLALDRQPANVFNGYLANVEQMQQGAFSRVRAATQLSPEWRTRHQGTLFQEEAPCALPLGESESRPCAVPFRPSASAPS